MIASSRLARGRHAVALVAVATALRTRLVRIARDVRGMQSPLLTGALRFARFFRAGFNCLHCFDCLQGLMKLRDTVRRLA